MHIDVVHGVRPCNTETYVPLMRDDCLENDEIPFRCLLTRNRTIRYERLPCCYVILFRNRCVKLTTCFPISDMAFMQSVFGCLIALCVLNLLECQNIISDCMSIKSSF